MPGRHDGVATSPGAPPRASQTAACPAKLPPPTTATRAAPVPRAKPSHARSGCAERESTAPAAVGLGGRAEAPVDVVVDHAHVLHERVHARGPHEAVPLR